MPDRVSAQIIELDENQAKQFFFDKKTQGKSLQRPETGSPLDSIIILVKGRWNFQPHLNVQEKMQKRRNDLQILEVKKNLLDSQRGKASRGLHKGIKSSFRLSQAQQKHLFKKYSIISKLSKTRSIQPIGKMIFNKIQQITAKWTMYFSNRHIRSFPQIMMVLFIETVYQQLFQRQIQIIKLSMQSYSIIMSSRDQLAGQENQESDDQLSEFMMDDIECKRVSTAPAKPLSDLGRFKREKEFSVLQQFVITANQMIHKSYEKYDLDSEDGQKVFKRYLTHIENLCEHYKVTTRSRDYRHSFSNAYKVLYKQGSLCYLTEIWDSAQEAFPYLWVNGEKYTFSAEVLETGTRLVTQHFKLQHILKNAYSKICEEANESLESIKRQICLSLQDFDAVWTKYEQTYITELMNIQKEARKMIVKSIELEHVLSSIEVRERLKGRLPTKMQEYRNTRNQLIQIMCKINAVANTEGKGRDDLDSQILEEAEGIIRKVTEQQSQSIRLLAEKIRTVFQKFRMLLRKYENNIELVDPQLRNNPDLVQLLMQYQNTWEKGKNYFLVPIKCKFLIHFSYIIEMTSQKYQQFRQQLLTRDADMFMSIPCLLILKSLDHEDKQMCQFFLPHLLQENSKTHKLYKSLTQEFNDWKTLNKQSFIYYNILEKNIIGRSYTSTEQQVVANYKGFEEMLNKLKCISMEMQRCCPIEWNNLLDAALSLLDN